LFTGALRATPSSVLETYADALAWPDNGQTARIAFTEERSFPFRRFPKRYAGAMYRQPNGAVAICYDEPRAVRLLIDGNEILLDDGSGIRPLPTEGGDARVIGNLIRGDLTALAEQWNTEATDDGFRLSPSASAESGDIDYIEVRIAEDRVQGVKVKQRNQVIREYKFGEIRWVTDAESSQVFSRE